MKIGRIHYAPAYKLEGARFAYETTKKSLERERQEAKQLKEELLRTRRKLAEVDATAPRSEYDGDAWYTYLTGNEFVDVSSFTSSFVAKEWLPGLRG